MNQEMDHSTVCKRCGGRAQVDNLPCFVCSGKGKIGFDEGELEGYFSKYLDDLSSEETEKPE